MPSISKEEGAVIENLFSWCASADDLIIIKKSIMEARKGRGLYDEAIKHNGDLNSFKFSVADATGLRLKVSGELSRVIWFIVKAAPARERMINAGIIFGTWVYTDALCKYPGHAKLNGKKIPLKKGARIGLFKRIHTGQLVGCWCFCKPVLPF